MSEVDKQGGRGSLQARGLMCAKTPDEGEVGQSGESVCVVGGLHCSGRINSSRVAEGARSGRGSVSFLMNWGPSAGRDGEPLKDFR